MHDQDIDFGDREFTVTIAARPEFIARRQSSLPQVVLGFALGIVVVMVSLGVVMAVVQVIRARAALNAAVTHEKHKTSLIEASKAAHEKTIAYACHQLRSENPFPPHSVFTHCWQRKEVRVHERMRERKRQK